MSGKTQSDFLRPGDLIVMETECYDFTHDKYLPSGLVGMVVGNAKWDSIEYPYHCYDVLFGEQIIRIWDAHIKKL